MAKKSNTKKATKEISVTFSFTPKTAEVTNIADIPLIVEDTFGKLSYVNVSTGGRNYDY